MRLLPPLRKALKSTISWGLRQTHSFNSCYWYPFSWQSMCQLQLNVLNNEEGPEPADPRTRQMTRSGCPWLQVLLVSCTWQPHPEHEQLKLNWVYLKARPPGFWIVACLLPLPPKKVQKLQLNDTQPLLHKHSHDATAFEGASSDLKMAAAKEAQHPCCQWPQADFFLGLAILFKGFKVAILCFGPSYKKPPLSQGQMPFSRFVY